MRLEHERIHLVAQLARLVGEREDVLDRAVVEIEPEPHQPFLGECDERALAMRVAFEQELALQHRAEGRGRVFEVGALSWRGSPKRDHDCAGRFAEAPDLLACRGSSARRVRRRCGR